MKITPLVKGPECFTVTSVETVEPEDRVGGVMFYAALTCACGKRAHIASHVVDPASLETKEFWIDMWTQLVEHERADMDVEPGLRGAIELQLQLWEREQGGRGYDTGR